MNYPLSLLSLAAAALPTAASTQVPPPPPVLEGTRLDVVAEGEAVRAPDVVTIGAGVVSQAPTAQEAMAANTKAMAATMAALRRAGVAERDIRTAAINLQPQYRYGENQPPILTGYQASNRVDVRFREIGKAGSILDALVAAGANQIEGPNFTVDAPEAALDEARTQAIAKARARAELYAKAAGLRVVRILTISEGERAMPPMPIARMAMAEAKSTPIAPGEQRLAVTLSVSFELR